MVVAPTDEFCDSQQEMFQSSATINSPQTMAADRNLRNPPISNAEIRLESAARLINVCQDKDKNLSDLRFKLKLQRLGIGNLKFRRKK